LEPPPPPDSAAVGRGYPLAVRPSWIEILAAATLVIVLFGAVLAILVATIPPGGPPALR
jgi:hypothetical protein